MDVKTLCLGVLSRGDASGYEIRKQLTEGPFNHFYDASFGSIYPALNRLSADGLLTCTALAQAKRPDKKVYRITTDGRIALINALADSPGNDRVRSEFTFMLFFGHLMSARHLEAVIEDRLGWYRAAVERMAECRAESADRPVGERFALGFGEAIYRAAAEYLEENAHVLLGEALLADKMVTE